MKKMYTLILFLATALAAGAQQEDQYTQFMYQKQVFNPGAAGHNGTAVISALVRSQWLGLEGAPETQLINFHLPIFNKRVGVGGNIIRQTIGLTERYEANAMYAYRIDFGRGKLGLGLQTSVRLIRTDFGDAIATQPAETDGAIPPGVESKYVPNFGAGAYYEAQDKRFFIGFSIPRFLQNNIDLADSEDVLTREIRHFFLMGGYRFPFGESNYVQPQVLLKYVFGAPFDADVNVNVHFMDKFTTGLSYRIGGSKSSSFGESISLLLAMDITEQFMFGLSYDSTLSQLRSYNSGSVEGVLVFRFGGKDEGDIKNIDNGRFGNDDWY